MNIYHIMLNIVSIETYIYSALLFVLIMASWIFGKKLPRYFGFTPMLVIILSSFIEMGWSQLSDRKCNEMGFEKGSCRIKVSRYEVDSFSLFDPISINLEVNRPSDLLDVYSAKTHSFSSKVMNKNQVFKISLYGSRFEIKDFISVYNPALEVLESKEQEIKALADDFLKVDPVFESKRDSSFKDIEKEDK